MSTKENKANDVKETPPTLGASVSSGKVHRDQREPGRDKITGPGMYDNEQVIPASGLLGGGQTDNASARHCVTKVLTATTTCAPTDAHTPTNDTNIISTTRERLVDYTSDNEWTLVNRQQPPRRRRRQNAHQLLSLDELFSTPSFERFFTIKFVGLDIDTDVNPIKLDSDLKREIGIPEKISKASKNTLLVETKSSQQSEKLKKITKLAGKDVTVHSHRRFNTSKGVVRDTRLNCATDEEIVDHLRPQGVVDVKRISTKREGVMTPTNTYIFTFNSATPPRALRVTDWMVLRVEDYNYRPQ